jgi:hypothetical protein
MSERWKYQIRIGLFFGFFMSLFTTAFDCFNTSFEDAFLPRNIILRVLIFVPVGIFWLGYSSWKKKIKSESTLDSPHNHSIHK